MLPDDKPKRKRYQFHLSTAVVMMFVAGGMIWAQFGRENLNFPIFTQADIDSGRWPKIFMTEQGWPFVFRRDYTRDVQLKTRDYEIRISGLVGNILVLVVLLFGVAWVCETLVYGTESL